MTKYQSLLPTLFVAVSVGVCCAQTNLTDSLVHQSLQRKYMVHLPPDHTLSTTWPLVINLHGGSGNMVSAQGFSMMNPVADQNGFIVAWPQGFGIAPPGFSWADGRNTSADMAGIDDVGFIDKLIDVLTEDFNVDADRVYMCGFSNGGFMVQRIACELPDRFAALASLGCSMDTSLYQNCHPSRSVPMAFFNGTSDPAMPYEGGPMQNPLVTPVVPVDTAVQFWVSHNQCQTANPVINFPDSFTTDNSTAELYTFTDCDCHADVRFYKLINGGHTWPGVFVASQAAVLGNTNRDIHASFELWDFFNSYSLCSPSTQTTGRQIQPSVEIFPNPASSVINLKISPAANQNLIIRNQLGQMVFKSQNLTQIDISSLQSGLYFVTLELAEMTFTHPLIKL